MKQFTESIELGKETNFSVKKALHFISYTWDCSKDAVMVFQRVKLDEKLRGDNIHERFFEFEDIVFKIKDCNAKQKKITNFFTVTRKCIILCKCFIPWYHFQIKVFWRKGLTLHSILQM